MRLPLSALHFVCLCLASLRSVAAYVAAGRQGMSASLIGTSVYIYGGTITYDGVGTQDLLIFDVDLAFNLSSPPWNPISGTSVHGPALVGQASAPGGPNNNQLVIFGGDPLTQPDPLYMYNPANNSWSNPPNTNTTSAAIPSNRDSLTAVTRLYDGKVFIFGGEAGANDSVCFNELYSYDSIHNMWTLLSSAPSARQAHSATMLVDGRMVLIGGANGAGTIPLNIIWLYDTTSGNWSVLNTTGIIPPPRLSHTSVVNFANHIIVYGGEDGENFVYNDTWVLDMSVAAPQWWVPPITGTSPIGRYSHAAVMAGVNMLVFFGQTGFTTLDNNIYSLDTQSWTWNSIYTPLHLEYTSTNSQPLSSIITTSTYVYTTPSLALPSVVADTTNVNSTAIIAGSVSASVVLIVVVCAIVIYCNRKLSVQIQRRETAFSNMKEDVSFRYSIQSSGGVNTLGASTSRFPPQNRTSTPVPSDPAHLTTTELLTSNVGDGATQYYYSGPSKHKKELSQTTASVSLLRTSASSNTSLTAGSLPRSTNSWISTDAESMQPWMSYPVRESSPPQPKPSHTVLAAAVTTASTDNSASADKLSKPANPSGASRSAITTQFAQALPRIPGPKPTSPVRSGATSPGGGRFAPKKELQSASKVLPVEETGFSAHTYEEKYQED